MKKIRLIKTNWYNIESDFRPNNKTLFWFGVVLFIAIVVKLLNYS